MNSKSGKRISPEIRAQIIQAWKNGLTHSKIAEKYDISKSGLRLLILKYKRTGDVKNLKNTGRKPSARTPENWRRMAEVLERNPNITRLELAKQLNMSVSSVNHMHAALKRSRRISNQEGSSELVNPVTGNLEPISESACQDWSHSSPSPSTASVTVITAAYSDWNDDDDGDNHSAGDAVGAHRCFLCDSIGAQVLDVHFSPETIPEVPVQVQKSLGVICFLGKVLKMRNEDLVTVMKEAEGRSPNEWGISLCSDPDCRGAVEKAMELWQEIKKLEAELVARGKEMIERIQRNLKDGSGSMDEQAVLNKRVREVLVAGQSMENGEVEPELEGLNDFDDDFHLSEDFSDFVDPPPSKKRCRGKPGSREGRKVPLTKSGSKAKSKLEKRKEPAGSMKKVDTSTKSSDDDCDDTMYSCQLCPTLERMDMDKFIAHIGFHSRCRNNCNGCNSYFPDSACWEHWQSCHVESPSGPPKAIHVSPAEAVGKIWDCSLRSKCKEKFASGEDRVRHELEVHGIPVPQGANDFNCSLCSSSNSKFYSLPELRLHKAIEHPDEAILSCSYCDTQFAIQSEKDGIRFLNLDQLRKHICEEHPEKMKKVKGPPLPQFLQTCHICGLVFSSFSFTKLDNHMVQAHSMNLYENYSCPICPQTKMRNADVWKHVKKWHWPDAPRLFICQYCGKCFRRRAIQRRHEQIHRNKETRPYQCELCGSSFAVANYLIQHRRVTHHHQQQLQEKEVRALGRDPWQV